MGEEKSMRILAGTLAGISMVTVGQPLDYLRTLYQVRLHRLPSVRQIYQEIGLRGFYKGASSIYLFAGAVTALEFETFQRSLEKLCSWGLKSGSDPSVSALMLAGFMTGTVTSFIYTPTEYAKIHSQIEHKPTIGSAYRIFHLLKTQGLQGLRKLYTGHTITLSKQSTGSALYYGGYYIMLNKLFNQKRETAATWKQLLAGGLAGLIYQVYSYPVDTIKANIQIGHKTFREMIESKFWLNPNFKNGFKASMLRSFIVDATNFAVYENVSQMLNKKALNLH